MFESVEDRLDAIAELFESETAGSKEALGKTQREVQRKLRSEVRQVLRSAKAGHRRQREGAGQAADEEVTRQEIAAEVSRQSDSSAGQSRRRPRRPA